MSPGRAPGRSVVRVAPAGSSSARSERRTRTSTGRFSPPAAKGRPSVVRGASTTCPFAVLTQMPQSCRTPLTTVFREAEGADAFPRQRMHRPGVVGCPAVQPGVVDGPDLRLRVGELLARDQGGRLDGQVEHRPATGGADPGEGATVASAGRPCGERDARSRQEEDRWDEQEHPAARRRVRDAARDVRLHEHLDEQERAERRDEHRDEDDPPGRRDLAVPQSLHPSVPVVFHGPSLAAGTVGVRRGCRRSPCPVPVAGQAWSRRAASPHRARSAYMGERVSGRRRGRRPRRAGQDRATVGAVAADGSVRDPAIRWTLG